MKIDGQDIVNNRYLVSFKICTRQWIYFRRFIFFPSFSSPKGIIFLCLREISIEEQVDHLLKQAMSVDNLCNMYEGWTPWI